MKDTGISASLARCRVCKIVLKTEDGGGVAMNAVFLYACRETLLRCAFVLCFRLSVLLYVSNAILLDVIVFRIIHGQNNKSE